MFGRHLESYEDQQQFAYTPLITWLLLPLWLMPFPLAVSLWCGLQFVLLLVAPLLIVSILRWRITLISLLILLFFSTFIYRYPINAYLLGQFIPFVFVCVIIALWGLVQGYETLSGIVLVLAMVRPEVTIIPVLVLLFMAFRRGQIKVIIIWFGGLTILWLLTRFWIGVWEFDFIDGILAYREYSDPIWPPSLLGDLQLGLAFVFLVLCWAIWMFRELRQLQHFSHLVWILSVAVIVSLLVFPQTGDYTLILGLIPCWLMMWVVAKNFFGWVPILGILLSPWLFHFFVPVTSLEHLIIPLALMVTLSLYWLVWKKKNISSQDSIAARLDTV